VGAPVKAAPEELQQRYYAHTSGSYDAMHVSPGDEHGVALDHISAFVASLGCTSVLDVGCGTGRGIAHVRERHPGVRAVAVEPVEAMIDEAVAKRGVPREAIVQGRGERLPFGDDEFDAVFELGVLHHVPEPNAVVREMTRVASRAVFLSDDNRFGWGARPLRPVKLGLAKLGLWSAANRLKTRGRGYSVSDHDGVAYSYSVYDSYRLLADWADRVILVPTVAQTSTSWYHTLLTADHVLLCAIRG
jgi:SAM-dependent methyltransferase